MTACNFDFSNKVAVVTGGGSGMGSAACRLLAEAGAQVVVVDNNGAAAERVAASLANARAVTADVREEADVARYVDVAVKSYGRIDLFFNNAGILGPAAPLAQATAQDFDLIFGINVRGCFLGLSAVMRAMIAQGTGGAIVNTASIAGLRASTHVGLYSASKFAVIGLTRNAAKEGGPHGIRVNAICPMATYTSFSVMSDAIVAATKAQVPLGRLAEADDMARAAMWLFSDAAALISGVILPVDGAQTA